MTVHTICDTCGMEYDWPGVTVGQQIFCCEGCARGVGCTCANRTAAIGGSTVVTGGGTVVTGRGTVVTPGGTVVAGDDDVIIVE